MPVGTGATARGFSYLKPVDPPDLPAQTLAWANQMDASEGRLQTVEGAVSGAGAVTGIKAAYLATDQVSAPTAGVVVPFDGKAASDPAQTGVFTLATSGANKGRITVSVAGIYLVQARVSLYQGAGNVTIRKNGTAITYGVASTSEAQARTLVRLAATDYLDVFMLGSTSAAILGGYWQGTVPQTWVDVMRLGTVAP